jgi:hypothetical protein
VKLHKLGKKLRREIAASPKKAALLGLITVVALYFWAPLVWKWMGKDKMAAGPEPAAATAGALPAAQPALPTALSPSLPAAAASDAPALPSWEQVVQWMHDDSRTKTAARPAQMRDPFDSPKTALAKAKPAEKAEPRPPAISPSAAGLVLSGTIIGPRRRVAQISGRTYTLGQTIAVAKEKESATATFKLTEVQARRAVLQSGGEKFELTMPEPGKSGKIELLVPNR